MNPFFRTVLFLFLFSHFLLGAEPMRTWTSSDGRTLEARFIEQDGSNPIFGMKVNNPEGFIAEIRGFSVQPP